MKVLRIPLLIALVVALGPLTVCAQTQTVLYSFGGAPNGNAPGGQLVLGNGGDFYGTTAAGGTGSPCEGGCGTVFRITTNGTVTILHSFGTQTGDGYMPETGLIQGSDGYLYGTTTHGGTSTACSGGCGTVFRISTGGTITILHSFTDGSDGAYPSGELVQGSDGNFYGTAGQGGADGYGTVFRISSSGTFTLLHTFAGGANDGLGPWDLVQGSDGYLYGTTQYGGTDNYGTVFRISTSGAYENLYSFGTYDGDGRNPLSGLIQGSDGNFYGTTSAGGTEDTSVEWLGYCREYSGMSWTWCGGSGGGTYGDGTLYRISPSGNYTNLYSFGNVINASLASIAQPSVAEPAGVTINWIPNGTHPIGRLVEGSDGNFFGTTIQGGAYSNGTVFWFSLVDGYGLLYSFGKSPDGAYPNVGLAEGINNRQFRGTTLSGGSSTTCNDGCGTAFELTLPPCTYTLGLTNIDMAAGGGSMMVDVFTAIGCPWTASTTYNWITITSGNTGDADGPVNFTIAANPSTSERVGTLTIAGQTVTITESGTTSGGTCTFLLGSPSADSTAAGGPGSVGITASNGCTWTATSNNGFIEITAGSSGSGNGTVSYLVAANTSTIARTGTITIAGQTFTVLQAAAGASSAVYDVLSSDTFKMSGLGRSATIQSQNSQTCTFTSNGTSGLEGTFDLYDGTYHYTGSYFVFGKRMELIIDANGLSAIASNSVDLIQGLANGAGLTLQNLSVSITHVTMSNISMKYGQPVKETCTIHGTASAVVDGKFVTKNFTHKAVKTNWSLVSGAIP